MQSLRRYSCGAVTTKALQYMIVVTSNARLEHYYRGYANDVTRSAKAAASGRGGKMKSFLLELFFTSL